MANTAKRAVPAKRPVRSMRAGDAEDSPLVDGTSNSRGDANQFIFGVVGSYTF